MLIKNQFILSLEMAWAANLSGLILVMTALDVLIITLKSTLKKGFINVYNNYAPKLQEFQQEIQQEQYSLLYIAVIRQATCVEGEL